LLRTAKGICIVAATRLGFALIVQGTRHLYYRLSIHSDNSRHVVVQHCMLHSEYSQLGP